MNKRIVFIQHASSIGGSVISLKEVIIDALMNNYECIVICVNQGICEVYDKIGAKTFICPVIPFDHNTAISHSLNFRGIFRMLRIVIKTLKSLSEINKVLKVIRPELIHLNSSTLVLYVLLFRPLKVPIICHIREHINSGRWGFRRYVIRRILDRFADKIIYISEDEYSILHTNKKKSHIIYNYVHKDVFQNCAKLKKNKKHILISLGGISSIKGASTLIESVKFLSDDYVLLLVGSPDPRTVEKEVLIKNNSLSFINMLLELLKDKSISNKVSFINSTLDISTYISMSDLLIFWGVVPHFPRPVYEAWLLKKPVLVYSKNPLGSFIGNETAFVLSDDNADLLAKTILNIFKSYEKAIEKANKGYEIACAKFTEKNFEILNEIYIELLNG